MCNISDTQVNVKTRKPLVYAKYIIFHAPDWCVQQKNILQNSLMVDFSHEILEKHKLKVFS